MSGLSEKYSRSPLRQTSAKVDFGDIFTQTRHEPKKRKALTMSMPSKVNMLIVIVLKICPAVGFFRLCHILICTSPTKAPLRSG